jgi:hypothetical protein
VVFVGKKIRTSGKKIQYAPPRKRYRTYAKKICISAQADESALTSTDTGSLINLEWLRQKLS